MPADARIPSAPEADAAPVRHGGRRRSSETEQAILQVTRELLVEAGVQGLTIEKVAARAGVAKTTIYRRWRDKDELALAVVLDMVEQIVEMPELGDTRAELLAFVNAAVKVLGSTLMGRVMQGLVSDLATDPELAQRSATASSPSATPRSSGSSHAGSPVAICGRTPMPRPPTSCSSARSTTGSC